MSYDSSRFTSVRSTDETSSTKKSPRSKFNWSKADTRALADCGFSLVFLGTLAWIAVTNLGLQKIVLGNLVALGTLVFVVVYVSSLKPILVKRASYKYRSLCNLIAGLLVLVGMLRTVWVNLPPATQLAISHLLSVIAAWLPFAILLIASGLYFFVFRNRLADNRATRVFDFDEDDLTLGTKKSTRTRSTLE